jgi:Zn-finger nucleic acid-binding protein
VDCPACKGVVVVVEYQRIELDYCTKCYGVWFDAGELSLLTERLSLQGTGLTVNEIAALPAKKVAEKPRHCPICRKNMGQLKDKHAAADKQGRVIDFLGEVFHVRG